MRLSRTRRSLIAAAQPMETWSSCMPEVGSESTLAGEASRRFSATMPAAVYWAIIRPELTPGVGAEERRQVAGAGHVEQPVDAALGDRADLGGGDGQEVGGEAERRAVEVAGRLDPAVGQHDRVVGDG